MIADHKPYSSYKGAGVLWLGAVPEHWSTLPLKRWVTINADVLPETTVPDRSFRYVDIGSVGTGILIQKPQRIRFADAPSRARRVVRNGDTLVSTVRTYLKAIYFVDGEADQLVCSTGFAVLTPCVGTVPQFVSYLVRSNAFTDRVAANSVGIAYPAIAESRFGSLHVSVPPFPEQAAIVRFLDHADRRIRRYIRAKQKLITLLEEQKQAIIHRAVTGRIDVRTGKPYPAYKDSRVEWLGRIPQRWRAVSLGRLTLDRCDGPFGSGLKSSHYTDEGIRVVRLQNIGHGTFNDEDAVYIAPEHYATLGDHSVQPGDLLIAGLGDPHHPAGRACVAPTNIRPAMVKADCFRFRVDHEAFLSEFAALHLTATASAASAVLSTGATRQRTNLQRTTGRHVVVPSKSEQAQVVEYCTAEKARLDAVEQAAGSEILLLREYRTRLIADVVTGKLDVREAAARLPEVDSLANEFDALTTQATETGMMAQEDATELSEELAMENEVII